jgi:periplasmic protein TonB
VRIQEAYPAEAVRNNQQGSVRMRVTIDTNGRVSDCQIVESSGSEVLDQGACDNMRRHARYSPTLDEQGNPTEGHEEINIVFEIR